MYKTYKLYIKQHKYNVNEKYKRNENNRNVLPTLMVPFRALLQHTELYILARQHNNINVIYFCI